MDGRMDGLKSSLTLELNPSCIFSYSSAMNGRTDLKSNLTLNFHLKF